MKKRMATWLLLCVFAGSGTVFAQDAGNEPAFELGQHYERLTPTQPTSSSPEQVEVAEVFWYGCPHCYAFDPYLERWMETKPDFVNVVRIPGVWNPAVRLHAQIYYTAEALGKIEEMHAAIFREIHENGNALDTEARIADFFSRFDVSDQDFKTAFESFAVHSRLERADELARRYRIASVPTVVINGKYTTNAVKTGSYESLMQVIDTLVEAERAGK